MTLFFGLIVIIVIAIVAFILVDKGMTGPAAEFAWIVKLIILLMALSALYYVAIGTGTSGLVIR